MPKLKPDEVAAFIARRDHAFKPIIALAGSPKLRQRAAPVDERVSLSAYDLYMHGKTLVGCQYGSVVPGRDFPLLLNLWRTGRLPLEKLITGRIRLEDVNNAFDDLAHGIGIRSVIVNE